MTHQKRLSDGLSSGPSREADGIMAPMLFDLGQLSLLPSVVREMSTGQNAVMLCSCKVRMFHSIRG